MPRVRKSKAQPSEAELAAQQTQAEVLAKMEKQGYKKYENRQTPNGELLLFREGESPDGKPTSRYARFRGGFYYTNDEAEQKRLAEIEERDDTLVAEVTLDTNAPTLPPV